ncbi:lipid-A-disaccharide synthase [bacterium]|nr:lipid-A-disaccharide synthase [bacterium]
MTTANKKIFIIAGEVSGDMHAGRLCKEIYKRYPDGALEIEGIGGQLMIDSGVNILHNIVDIAVIGIIEGLKNVRPLLRIFSEIKKIFEQNPPDLLILIDYSGFNLKVAHVAKKFGIKTVYYIAPQIWAWRKYRINEIKKYVDEVIAVFPFEVDMYKDAGIKVNYYGHPLIDIVSTSLSKEERVKRYNLSGKEKVITLLPGSRKKEISVLLPVMLNVIKKLKEVVPELKVIMNTVSNRQDGYKDFLTELELCDVFLEDKYPYDSITESTLVMVASGTATLETAMLHTPMLVMYKTSKFNEYLVKNLIKVENIALANIVSGRRVVPEFTQDDVNADTIYPSAMEIMMNKELNQKLRSDLRESVEKLGTEGVIEKISKRMVEIIEN